MNTIVFQLRRIMRQMWFLPAAFSLAAVLTIILAYLSARLAPEKLPFTMPSDAVVSILTILATSLLTVAVFALSTMVTALSSAAQTSTPRAVPLIVADRSAQTSISVFIGAFLYAIVGIIGLSAGVYSEAGRLVLFFVTLCVVLVVVGALIRWIGQISAIGRVSETIRRVEHASAMAFESLGPDCLFGCAAQNHAPTGHPVRSERLGYVQHFDAARLNELARTHMLSVHVTARPGAYVHPQRPLAVVTGRLDADTEDAIRAAFLVGHSRTFESDPRFGLVTLNEVASRALSPGINDSGTAIEVIGTIARVLWGWAADDRKPELLYEHVTVPALLIDDLFEDAFRPIARDGAGHIEVTLRLLSALETLGAAGGNLSLAARKAATDAHERASHVLTASRDREALRQASSFLR